MSVADLFESLDCGKPSENMESAQSWMKDHQNRFGHFIGGQFHQPESREFVSGSKTSVILGTDDDVEAALKAAQFSVWSLLSNHDRSVHLFNVGRQMEKNQSLLSSMEMMELKTSGLESANIIIPSLINNFYYYSSKAELHSVSVSPGITGIILESSSSILKYSESIGQSLSVGRPVVLKAFFKTPLLALLIGEMFFRAGCPSGAFNVINGTETLGQTLSTHPLLDHVVFYGPEKNAQVFRKITAGSSKSCELYSGTFGKCSMIICENSDMDSAVEDTVRAGFHFANSGIKLLIQEPIFEEFISKLKNRLNKVDISRSSWSQSEEVRKAVQEAEAEGAEVYRFFSNSIPLLLSVNTTSRILNDPFVIGAYICALPFRFLKESIALANNCSQSLFSPSLTSLYIESISTALEMSKHLTSSIIWINNIFEFDSLTNSTWSYPYSKALSNTFTPSLDHSTFGLMSSSSSSSTSLSPPTFISTEPLTEQYYKLYIGGTLRVADVSRRLFGSSKQVVEVGEASRKNVRDAVEAASKALYKWKQSSCNTRSRILFLLAENLRARSNEFVRKMSEFSDRDKESCTNEVNESLKMLFITASSLADKSEGKVISTQLNNGVVLERIEPLGVIGIICPSTFPLLSFVSLMAASVSKGNTVVIIPSESYPLAALDFSSILETLNLPPGVVNILSGSKDHLTRTLVEHHGVHAVWYFGSSQGSQFVEYTSSVNFKSTWVNYGVEKESWTSEEIKQELHFHSIKKKSIWLPSGDIFVD